LLIGTWQLIVHKTHPVEKVLYCYPHCTKLCSKLQMDKINSRINGWRKSDANVFWGEVAPMDHLVQFYENDESFFNTLEGFAASGFIAGDSAIIIATPGHRAKLNKLLHEEGFDMKRLVAEGRFIELDAAECLSKFLVKNWPDRTLFNNFVTDLLALARKENSNRKVRAFGEMVAVLWEQGHNGATVYLEMLWHELHRNDAFSLYCAYPKSGFTEHAHDSLKVFVKAIRK
jgi:hypothetical protein